MPLVHECNWLGCHRVVTSSHKYCDYHYQQHKRKWEESRSRQDKLQADKLYNQERRDQEANAFYHTSRWTKVRDFVKSRDMMTSGLSGKVLSDHDYIVDHIVPRRLCADAYDDTNLWLLSRKEHNRKTKYEKVLPDSVLKNLTADDWRKKLSVNRNQARENVTQTSQN